MKSFEREHYADTHQRIQLKDGGYNQGKTNYSSDFDVDIQNPVTITLFSVLTHRHFNSDEIWTLLSPFNSLSLA